MTPNDIETRFVRALEFRGDPSWNYKSVVYPYNTLYFVLSGDGHVRIGQQVTDLIPEYVYLIPAHTVYDCWCDTGIHKLYIEIHVESLPGLDLLQDRGQVSAFPYDAEKTRLLIQQIQNGPAGQLWLRGETEKIIARFLTETDVKPLPDMARFRPILTDISRKLSADLRLSDIARSNGWHPSVLSRAFHKTFGCSLKHYVETFLMNAIREELILTKKSIKELAAQFHFCDAYYFSAFFKRHEGISPTRYRELHARF